MAAYSEGNIHPSIHLDFYFLFPIDIIIKRVLYHHHITCSYVGLRSKVKGMAASGVLLFKREKYIRLNNADAGKGRRRKKRKKRPFDSLRYNRRPFVYSIDWRPHGRIMYNNSSSKNSSSRQSSPRSLCVTWTHPRLIERKKKKKIENSCYLV